MKKVKVLGISTSLLIIIVATIYFVTKPEDKFEAISENHTFSNGQKLIMESGLDIMLLETNIVKYPFSVDDTVTTYEINDGSLLTITERLLPNKDQFIFFKWMDHSSQNNEDKNRQQDTANQINFKLTFNDTNKHSITSFSAFDIERPHDNTVGIDETTYPNGLFTFSYFEAHNTDVMLGKNYVSKKLIKEYEDASTSFIRELIDERASYMINQYDTTSELVFDMVYDKGLISEQWLMISEGFLFEEQEELEEFIKLSNEKYRTINEWYTAEGVFSKLPWSIEPFVEEGYGRNLNYYRENEVLKRYRDFAKERYYYNLLVNSIAYFENHEKNEDNLLETHYTSTWLKNDYGTTAPYIDSRHNELGAIYLKAITEEFDLAYDNDPMKTYADFMLEQESLNNIIRISDDAYFIADYYDPSVDAKLTHVSLNHVLGIMNLLTRVYLDTNDQAYLDIAVKINNALQETEDLWIREDNDLWYQINDQLELEGRDYPIVTLRDLIDAEILWQTVNNSSNHMYDKFIKPKVKYLLSENIEIEEAIIHRLEQANYNVEELLTN